MCECLFFLPLLEAFLMRMYLLYPDSALCVYCLGVYYHVNIKIPPNSYVVVLKIAAGIYVMDDPNAS